MNIQRPHSLQGRLILGLLLCLLLTLGGTGLMSYLVTQHEADEIFNARLATSARVFDVLVARKVATATLNHPIVLALPVELETPGSGETQSSGHRYENKIAFQVWSDDGRLLVRSASAPEEAFAPLRPGYSEAMLAGRRWEVFTLASDNTWVQVAEHHDIREELADDLSNSLITPLLAGSVVLVFLSYGIVRLGLGSLGQLAAHLRSRNPDSLAPIGLEQPPREVETVVSAINLLLKRMQQSREREIRFTDAAAHELKTPLAALRIHADNLRQATTPQEQSQSLEQLTRSLDRAQRLSEQLLALSAVQSDSRREATCAISIVEWVADVISDLEPVLHRKGQQFEAHGLEQLETIAFEGQPLRLHRMLSNLLDNASRYGDAASMIRLDAKTDGDALIMSVTNTGETIPPAMLGRILEPYVRVLGTRTEGTGLGLAIVREIVAQHGGQLQVQSEAATRQTVFTVRLPLVGHPINDSVSRIS